MKKTFITLLLISVACSIFGDNAEAIIDVNEVTTAPTIDGNIDEVYENFQKIDTFYQFEPQWGAPISEDTEVFFAYDKENLYIAFKCYDEHHKEIRARLSKREDFSNSDSVTVYLDTFQTKRQGFIFGVTPYGIQFDGVRDDESRRRKDFSWDGLWYSHGKIYDWGYFVEMKIPFKTIRFPSNTDRQQWGMIAVRRIARKGEAGVSVKMDRNVRGFLSQAATLSIEKNLKTGKNFEIIPSITGNRTNESGFEQEFGSSLKYGITSNLILDLTVNPDFSQIEADAGKIDVNQRFPLRYPEKRSFFLESKSIFDMPINLFYSRKIVDPEWGAKLSGKIGKSSLGVLLARDRVLMETGESPEDDLYSNAMIGVLRYKYNLKESSHIGIYMSNRRLEGSDNFVFSADSFLKFSNLVFKFQGAYSKTGDKKGNAVNSSLSYNTRRLNLSLGYNQYSSDFNSDIGFLRRVDYRTYYIFTGYNFYPEKEYLRRFGPSVMFTQNFDWHSGELLDTQMFFRLSASSFKNSHFSFRLGLEREIFADMTFDKTTFGFDYRIDLTKTFSIGGEFGFGDAVNYDEENPHAGYSYRLNVNSEFTFFSRITNRLSLNNYYFYNSGEDKPELKMNILRYKGTLLLNRQFSSRFIFEYNDYYNSTYYSLLLSYELNPGTALFLGGTSEWFRDVGQTEPKWSLFFKVSYLLRV